MDSNTQLSEDKMDSNAQLSEDVINQIKDFGRHYLTEELRLSIGELIPNKELRERFEKYRLCFECSRPNTGYSWCQSCNSKHFQQDFDK